MTFTSISIDSNTVHVKMMEVNQAINKAVYTKVMSKNQASYKRKLGDKLHDKYFSKRYLSEQDPFIEIYSDSDSDGDSVKEVKEVKEVTINPSNQMSNNNVLTKNDFNACFRAVSNSANGNCFFEAMEHLLSGSLYEFKHGVTTAEQIRFMVGEFYRDFDKDINYPENTIEYTIKIGNMFDNMDDEMPHDYNIYNDKVWASMTDVLICSLIFELNINLYKYSSESNAYFLEKVKSQYNFPESVNLLYNGVDHFEALEYN